MLDLSPERAQELWHEATLAIAHATERSGERALGPEVARAEAEAWAEAVDFDAPAAPVDVLRALVRGLARGHVQTGHPAYFGLPQAAPASIALVAEALAAAYNPQLAARAHAPFAVAVEERLIAAVGERFGYPREEADGVFTSGGAEANATALHAALAHAFPAVTARGVRALAGQPTAYASTGAHPTVARAARLAGLGDDAVRVVAGDALGRMSIDALRDALGRDRARGDLPFLVVGTAGATATGAIDPLAELAEVAARAGVWLHVDAAWGGLLALVPELAGELAGIARADSITFDPHKALSVPLGAGMLLTRRKGALAAAFHARAGYMPRDASREPHARGVTWSRRFTGAPLFAVLATAGWEGLTASLRTQVALGDRLRGGLAADGWSLVNDTRLPVICFHDATRPDGATARFLEAAARAVLASGAGWLSVARLSSGARALRASVTTHRTRALDVDRLVAALAAARRATPAGGV